MARLRSPLSEQHVFVDAHNVKHTKVCVYQARIQTGVLRWMKPFPRKDCTKNSGSIRFCCTVEHVQLKNVTVDVMNIIVTITVDVTV